MHDAYPGLCDCGLASSLGFLYDLCDLLKAMTTDLKPNFVSLKLAGYFKRKKRRRLRCVGTLKHNSKPLYILIGHHLLSGTAPHITWFLI